MAELTVQDQLKQLSGQMTELFKYVVQMEQQIRGDLQQLKNDVQQLKSDVQQLKSDVQQLKTEVAALNTKYETLDAKFDHFIGFIGRVMLQEHRRIDYDINEYRSTVNRRLDKIETHLNQLGTAV